jgi:hypothetical protein
LPTFETHGVAFKKYLSKLIIDLTSTSVHDNMAVRDIMPKKLQFGELLGRSVGKPSILGLKT